VDVANQSDAFIKQEDRPGFRSSTSWCASRLHDVTTWRPVYVSEENNFYSFGLKLLFCLSVYSQMLLSFDANIQSYINFDEQKRM
jgi:hypothetical protein